MEDRLVRIETDLASLKAHVADMREHYATKDDVVRLEAKLYKAMNQQTWRFVSWTTGVAAMLVSAVYFVARNVP
jgi:hypothetical protein